MTEPQSIDKLDLFNVQFLNLERLMVSKKNFCVEEKDQRIHYGPEVSVSIHKLEV